jgi:hypothetical protein
MRGEGVGLRVLANEYSCEGAHGAQINFGDLTSYLTYDIPNKNYTLASCTKGTMTYKDTYSCT